MFIETRPPNSLLFFSGAVGRHLAWRKVEDRAAEKTFDGVVRFFYKHSIPSGIEDLLPMRMVISSE
jgi:hypothetical protein